MGESETYSEEEHTASRRRMHRKYFKPTTPKSVKTLLILIDGLISCESRTSNFIRDQLR
jgi:hypothetical protein